MKLCDCGCGKEVVWYKANFFDCTLQLASLGHVVFRVSEKQWRDDMAKVIGQFRSIVASFYPEAKRRNSSY